MAIFFSWIFRRSFRSTSAVPPGRRAAPSCPKDLTQMVEQSGGRQEHIGPAHLVEVLHKELCILVSLFCRFIEIRPGPLTILLDTLSGEVQFPKSILGILVALLGGLGEVGHCFGHVFRNIFPFQIQLSQTVGGAGVPLRRRFSIPGYGFIRSLWFCRTFPSAY